MEVDKAVFCVYTHSIDGKVFYIGCGTMKRPWNFSARTLRWKSIAKNKNVSVEIIERFTSIDEAQEFERLLIEQTNPPANFHNTSFTFKKDNGLGIIDQCIIGIGIASELTGISRRQACMNAGLNEITLRRFMNKETDMNLNNFVKICELGFGMSFMKVIMMGGD